MSGCPADVSRAPSPITLRAGARVATPEPGIVVVWSGQSWQAMEWREAERYARDQASREEREATVSDERHETASGYRVCADGVPRRRRLGHWGQDVTERRRHEDEWYVRGWRERAAYVEEGQAPWPAQIREHRAQCREGVERIMRGADASERAEEADELAGAEGLAHPTPRPAAEQLDAAYERGYAAGRNATYEVAMRVMREQVEQAMREQQQREQADKQAGKTEQSRQTSKQSKQNQSRKV